jgi:exopolysaccharide biosynthesis polyprenyl glycosylphosphotransferase
MLRRFSVDFAIFSMLMDAGLVMLALRLAVVLRPSMDEWFSFARPLPSIPQIEALLYPVFALVWVLMLLLFAVYDGRRHFRFVDEVASLTSASVLATVALAGFLYLSYREYSRVLFLTFALIAFGLLVGVRVVYRLLFRLRAAEHGAGQRRVLILGAGPVGRKIAEQIGKHQGNRLELAGFLDDDPLKLKLPTVLGKIEQAVDIIREKNIDEVIIALPSRVWSRISALVSELHELPVRVWVAPDYYTLALHRARVEELAGIPLIDLRAPALNEYQRLTKRIFDLSLTLLIMPFVLPLMGLIAIAIRLDSPGPIIFSQTRVGENGKLFKMFKFRSMVKDADKMRHVIEQVDENGRIIQDKRKHDPRVTRVGRFLRRTSLDELPQLFNVLKGEMSLVGPRPEMPHLVAQYELWQRKRFAVPQGITGWWQVNGRSDKPMHQHTEDDLYYVQNYSLWLDVVILFKTLVAVVRRKGAY